MLECAVITNLSASAPAVSSGLNDTPAVRKAMFRVFLRSRVGKLTGGELSAVQFVLGANANNQAAFDAVCEAYSAQTFSGSTTPLTDFLQWLLDHQQQIIAFIVAIVSLFA